MKKPASSISRRTSTCGTRARRCARQRRERAVRRAVRLPVKRAVQASGDPAVGLVKGVQLA